MATSSASSVAFVAAIIIATVVAMLCAQPAQAFITYSPRACDYRHETCICLYDDDGCSNNNSCHPTRRNFAAACLSGIITVPLITSIKSAGALTPDQASQNYDTYADTYDKLDGGSIATSLGIDEARTKLLGMARGDVLEIGVGTGLNLASYQFGEGGVTSLTLVDISDGMLSQAEARIQQMNIDKNIPIQFVKADATSELVSIFGENKFDSVVDTFSLCVMGNEGAKKCIEEMAGVVKPSGKILLVENTRSSNPLLGSYQDLTASSAADLGGKGCVYNQNVGEMINKSKGMRLEKEESFAAGLFRSFVCTKS
ncbi:methyltransferase [Skeletonema marinoi]|uniref:Methyltransferase n=1 Tax=Skeletonema marinoi TaxID=267567 RepID=A0AAD9DI68_9STRA|nr:methyltransferase [Skeletonema marinoi]